MNQQCEQCGSDNTFLLKYWQLSNAKSGGLIYVKDGKKQRQCTTVYRYECKDCHTKFNVCRHYAVEVREK